MAGGNEAHPASNAHPTSNIPAVAIALTTLTFLIIVIRLVFRKLKDEKFKPDDYVISFAFVFYIVDTISTIIINDYGSTPGLINPKKLPPEAIHAAIIGSKWLLVGRPFYLSYIWSLKGCMLIYYTRLTDRLNERLLVDITAVALVLTYISSMVTFYTECKPLHLAWQVFPDIPPCAKAPDAVLVMGITNIVTDLMIIGIPLPLLMRLQLPLKTKIQLGCLFGATIFIIIISILRILVVLGHLTTHNRLLWGQIECFSATVVANAPIIRGLLQHGYEQLSSRRLRNSSRDIQSGAEQGSAGNIKATEPIKRAERSATQKDDRGPLGNVWRTLKTRASSLRSSDRVIETSVELLQTRHTARPEDTDEPAPPAPEEGVDRKPVFDVYMGEDKEKRPMAKIHSHAFSSHHFHRPKFNFGERKERRRQQKSSGSSKALLTGD